MKYTSSTYSIPNERASLRAMCEVFAIAMFDKLDAKLKGGRDGWDSENWTPEEILEALKEHVDKGDPIDIANFAMFLWNREDFPHIKLQKEKGK